MAAPRPSDLPDGGRITRLSITTPDPTALRDVAGISVREGQWNVAAAINGIDLV
jgi:hypothetical protein